MPDVLRVVIDTNLIMSAMLSDRGAAAKLIDWLTGDEDYFQLLLSEPIWQEYTTVASWLIPESRQDERVRIFETLHHHAEWVEPTQPLEVCSDASDNRFLECAVEGHAAFLVTKNIRHFPHKFYRDVRIVKISAFLSVLEALAREHHG
jgi:putative PIN family toxin of toxin-antitoxin system